MLPEFKSQFIEEDQLIENITVILYLSVFIVGLVGLLFSKQKNRKLLIIFIILALFVTLEELSYGERYYGFSAPRIFDYKMDTVHDLFFLFFKTIKVIYEKYGKIVFFIIALASILPLFFLYRAWKYFFPLFFKLIREPEYFYFLLFIVFGFVALLFDLGVIKHDFMKFMEEIMELNAGIALLFATIALLIKPANSE